MTWRRGLSRIHRNDTGCEDGEITRCGEGEVLAGVIRRQGASGLGTKRFCARERIPEHRFYGWRRTLRQCDEYGTQDHSRARGKHRPQDLQGEAVRDSDAVGTARPVRTGGIRRGGLLSVHVAGDGAGHRGRQEDHSAFLPVSLPLSLGVPIEVVHPRGHVVRAATVTRLSPSPSPIRSLSPPPGVTGRHRYVGETASRSTPIVGFLA